MLKDQYNRGRDAALAHFKIANLTQGAQGYNPTLNGQTGSAQNAGLKAPAPASPPLAAGAAKSQVLG
jgi:hypothetical protein